MGRKSQFSQQSNTWFIDRNPGKALYPGLVQPTKTRSQRAVRGKHEFKERGKVNNMEGNGCVQNTLFEILMNKNIKEENMGCLFLLFHYKNADRKFVLIDH